MPGWGEPHERPRATCSVSHCTQPSVIQLVAKPPAFSTLAAHTRLALKCGRRDRTFDFCIDHGPVYHELGYETVDGEAYQAKLV